ncbi:MAG: sigma-70 family RNA polymerase sigma factor [Anaerolineae bacterium]|nr:sigma-70 family RNA polymerase sigma factor [Anaerolineae bacterium]
MTEHSLMRQAQAGDRMALGELYSQHWPAIFRYLYYRVGDRQAAEDLSAEVFTRMLESLPRYRSTGVPFKAWLFRIARNLAVDHFRKAGKQVAVSLDPEMENHMEEEPSSRVEKNLTNARLQSALSTLNADQRDVVIMRIIGEMPIGEVAQSLGKSEDAVKGLQRRGLIALRHTLADWKVDYDELI